MRERIASLDDPRLDDYRNVPDPDLLAARGCFIAEGRLVVSRLLDSARFPTRSVLVTATAGDAMADALARRPDVSVYEVEQQVMNQVTGVNMHRGCLAVGVRPPGRPIDTLVASSRRLLAVEEIGNADNVGSLFRNAAAFGIDGVLLDPRTTDPLYRKALRTSMGAVLQVPFARTEALAATLHSCHAAGFLVVALTPAGDAAPLRQAAASLTGEPCVLVVGHEGSGLSEAAMAACDMRVRIPMSDGVDSLNVATAAAIAMYELSLAGGT